MARLLVEEDTVQKMVATGAITGDAVYWLAYARQARVARIAAIQAELARRAAAKN